MNHAIFVSDLSNLRFYKEGLFDRLYYGNEFCEHLMPSPEQLRAALEFASDKNISFTFVSPILYERGLEKASELIGILPDDAEVVVNDFGLLEYISGRRLRLVAGRLLVSAIKDPRIGRESSFQQYFQASNLQPAFMNMLRDKGFRRVEIDNVRQGLDLSGAGDFSASLYYPFVSCSVARKCLFANMKSQSESDFPNTGFASACSGNCEGRAMSALVGGCRIAIMGNAQFYRNDSPPNCAESSCIDRFTYMPVFPNSNNRGFCVKEHDK